MSTYLLSYRINGIKCIDKMIEIRFYDKTVSKQSFDFSEHNVKGIYGENGSGKSGIIIGMQILKNLAIEKHYLSNNVMQTKLYETVNKRTNVLAIEIEMIDGNGNDGYSMIKYSIELRYDDIASEYYIYHESLDQRNANSIPNKYHSFYEVKNGNLVLGSAFDQDIKCSQYLIDHSKNLLNKMTFFNYLISLDQKEQTLGNIDTSSLLSLSNFLFNIDIYLDKEDDHSEYLIRGLLNKDNSQINMIMEALNYNRYGSLSSVVAVKKSAYPYLVKEIKQLETFLKLFKSDIVSVELDRKENRDHYECELVINYGSYKVNAEYESTGIKKLLRLFTRFQNVANGGISFIDELDSNLHDVYLCKLLEYFMNFTNGQLCFTSHNLGPMEILETNKNSIDFLSKDRTINSWIKNGNYHAETLYQRGMIKNNPFNIDATDFISIFGVDEEI